MALERSVNAKLILLKMYYDAFLAKNSEGQYADPNITVPKLIAQVNPLIEQLAAIQARPTCGNHLMKEFAELKDKDPLLKLRCPDLYRKLAQLVFDDVIRLAFYDLFPAKPRFQHYEFMDGKFQDMFCQIWEQENQTIDFLRSISLEAEKKISEALTAFSPIHDDICCQDLFETVIPEAVKTPAESISTITCR